MAQLPPKAPSMMTTHQNLAAPPFPRHHRIPMQPSSSSSATALNHPSSPPPPPHHQFSSSSSCNWMDEFLDFSSARRAAHRRSASDSVAFLKSPHIAGLSFDRLDDEQLLSMFSDDIAAPPTVGSSSNASSPRLDQNSNNDEVMHDDVNANNDINGHHNVNNQQQPKSEPDCSGDFNDLDSHESTGGPPLPTSPVDPKRVKRILANRQSAQRSRMRKLQYISELERSVTSLQSEVSVLSPRVAFLDHQRLILNVDNSALKQRIAALAQRKLFKDAHQEALRKEIERLRQVYHNQTLNKMDNNDNHTTSQNDATPPQQHHTPVDIMIGSQ